MRTRVVVGLALIMALSVPTPSARADAAPTRVENLTPSTFYGHSLAVRGDRLYFSSDDGRILSVAKTGGVPTVEVKAAAVGLAVDARGLYYAGDDGVFVLALDGPERRPTLLAPLAEALLLAADADSLYCVIPGFTHRADYGVYRVPKRGGEPALLWRSTPGDQPAVAVDDHYIYLASWSHGTFFRLAKSGGKRVKLAHGQGHPVSIAVDGTYLYWYSEGSAEVRRAPKVGARTIEVIGHEVDTEPVLVHDTGVYWFEGGPGPTGYRLMVLRPGTTRAARIAGDLNAPDGLLIDDGFAYISDTTDEHMIRLKL
jgi:hypothetical protein